MILSDASFTPPAAGTLTDRLATKLLPDTRDLPFLSLSLQASLVVIPFALWLFVNPSFHWAFALLYWAVVFGVFVDRFILMLHNTSHRPLTHRNLGWLAKYIPWVLGPFFGETPETYFAHHIGMHHPENNLAPDLSSTMRYQRDSFRHFLHYFFTFFFRGIWDLSKYFLARGRTKLLRNTILGELSFFLAVGLLLAINWRAAVTVFVVPFVAVRFLMMCGNWGQHAFIDPAAPDNCYRNSITCINSRYNRRCFNDGYHIGHHLFPRMHWTEMPGELNEHWESYRKERALIFEGIDFFMVWFFLMTKQYKTLAKKLVPLDETRLPEAEAIALLKSRLVPI